MSQEHWEVWREVKRDEWIYDGQLRTYNAALARLPHVRKHHPKSAVRIIHHLDGVRRIVYQEVSLQAQRDADRRMR